jgi:hypothetical protein
MTEGLKEYTVGIEAFNKPGPRLKPSCADGYDPQQDGSVRQHIRKLRQKLKEYNRTEGTPDPLLVELPNRQYRLSFHGPQPGQASRQQTQRILLGSGRLHSFGSGSGGILARFLTPLRCRHSTRSFGASPLVPVPRQHQAHRCVSGDPTVLEKRKTSVARLGLERPRALPRRRKLRKSGRCLGWTL